MSEAFNKLEKNVCKIICKDTNEEGTGFLISANLILTVFHTIQDSKNILVIFNENEEYEVMIHELINDSYKELDIAILQLNSSKNHYEPIDILDISLPTGIRWYSRGYPSSKNSQIENFQTVDCIINEQYNHRQESKFDIDLNINKKIPNYNGVSGAPLIVNDVIVGIINSSRSIGGDDIELKALSIKYFKNLLIQLGVTVKNEYPTDGIDIHSASSFDKLNTRDFRNVEEKILAVNNDISKARLNNYNRVTTHGKVEVSLYNQRDISAVKYIIFDECQVELLNFCENRNNFDLSHDEIQQLIDSYITRARNIIDDRSRNHKYPNLSDDELKKIILNLIDECYLSFDEDGIYDA